ncbi:MAG: ANTAR domain-containing protein [Anaerolineales bacterium]|nr:ANTAR domain-containing protein [Anaerolineales bacterium]
MHILIVENDTTVRRELREMLRHLGHTVAPAADSRDAVTVARQRTCDLAILAGELPFGDGLHTARKLVRANPMPILLLLDSAADKWFADVSNLPIYGCLFQPVGLPALHVAISVAAERFDEMHVLSSRVRDLEEALETRKLIDRAKGKLIRMGMSEQKAFLSIQTRARRTQKTMREVAHAILGD